MSPSLEFKLFASLLAKAFVAGVELLEVKGCRFLHLHHLKDENSSPQPPSRQTLY